ncbi:uncharacterized protein LOC123268091 [Cotesia glomerata]|uniref:uncharacterized protein LOC123268091 n=1 Tax=Cotesia glomerata TaxID=32391 RepID=UPI001D010DEA|nr:uncharacterized protein LOC123268091 [Cotesia glomerata]
MSASTLSGLFLLIILIESSPLLVDDDPENRCVLRDVECKPGLQRPCCNLNDYCKQMDSEDSFKCTEKNLKPALGRFCEIHEDCDGIWHSKCSKNKCVCRENNIKYNETACAPILGGFCWKNETCVTENSVCIDQECQCKENHTQILNKCIFTV